MASTSVTRPAMLAGPTARQRRPARVRESSRGSAAARAAAAGGVCAPACVAREAETVLDCANAAGAIARTSGRGRARVSRIVGEGRKGTDGTARRHDGYGLGRARVEGWRDRLPVEA